MVKLGVGKSTQEIRVRNRLSLRGTSVFYNDAVIHAITDAEYVYVHMFPDILD